MKIIDTSGLPQTSIKKQIIDQSAHVIISFMIVFVILYESNTIQNSIAIGAIGGLWFGYLREIVQHRKLLLPFWSRIDICFWVVGGFLAGIVIGFSH